MSKWLAAFAYTYSAVICVSEVHSSDRVDRGLLALYDFDEGKGAVVRDRAGQGDPLDLKIADPKAVEWVRGGLVIRSATSIVSVKPATAIPLAVQDSHEITIEAWVRPASDSQKGPARVVSLSRDSSQRNFTLGQEQHTWDVRLRTSRTDKNGLPSMTSAAKSLLPELTHVVFTRDANDEAVLYLNGAPSVHRRMEGRFNNWTPDFRLIVANEASGDRPWLGELHLVALYRNALSAEEVQRNFAAGPDGTAPQPATPEMVSADLFQKHIGALFAQHCLECHDSAIHKGELDLSRKESALAGGENGIAIVPGESDGSLLWESVATNHMPKDRPPLLDDEKAALKQWLETGAVYATDRIDPAIYRRTKSSGQIWVRRLTVPEYIATVRSTVGVDIAKEARELLPADLRADGFRNTAYNLSVDLKHVEAYSQLAELIVQRMDVSAFVRRFTKRQTLSTDDTMREHVANMGQWVLRGPLDEREVNNYCGIATTVASAGGDYELANMCMLEAMLQSPRFLYRIESQRSSSQTVDAFALASRLSYLLWGTSPDETLLKAAASGELREPLRQQAEVQRMLQDPQAVEQSLVFAADWLNLQRLENLRPDPVRFPDWDAQLADDMREETLAFFREVIWTQQRPLSDLLHAQLTFATPALAKHYGLEPAGEALSRYDLTSVPARGGLLTQGSVLTIGGNEASMVSRGLFILHDLLRGTINAPPPCVITTPPATQAGLTQRGIAEQRIADTRCGVCHMRFEPLAFGLEKFDGVGAFHETDAHGNRLRDDGDILFPGQSDPVRYQTAAEMMQLLADSDRVRESLTWKVVQFAMGRPLTADDAPIVQQIHASSQQNGGTYSSLMTAIALSDLVQKGGQPSQP